MVVANQLGIDETPDPKKKDLKVRVEGKLNKGTKNEVTVSGTLTLKGVEIPTAPPSKASKLEQKYQFTSSIDLVDKIHSELNNPDWLSDNIRFGGMLGYVTDADAITTQFAMRVYPAYHRHMNSRLDSMKNWGRRLSLLLAVGPTLDNDTEKFEDIGMVYTVGGGVDVTHGVSLFGGVSYFSATQPDMDNEDWEHSVTFGIALNAELWERVQSEVSE